MKNFVEWSQKNNMMKNFVEWLELQANIIGLSPTELLEKSNMNPILFNDWKNKGRNPTTGSIIIITKTISKLRKDKTYKELILDAIKTEGQQ